MKKSIAIFTIPIAVFILLGALGSTVLWSPTDTFAAWGWNLSIILVPSVALLAQWTFAKERQMPLLLTLTVVAILNTAIVIGSRLGAWTGQDWSNALTGHGLPDLPGKTIMGGLLLMLAVYFLLQRWWRFSAGMADVLIMGLALGAVIGRMGCLIAGCCYGIPTESNWGICYGPGTPAFERHLQEGLLSESAVSTVFLYPIQAFFIAGNLLIFTLLWHFRNKLTRPGALAFLGFGLITFQRFGLEFIRDVATNRGGFGLVWAGLKAGQWIMLGIAITSLAGFYVVQFGRQKNPNANPLPCPSPETATLAYTLGGITLGGFMLRDLMTLDETLLILLSCAPAVWMLGAKIWQERRAGKVVLAPASLLSLTAIILTIPAIDSLPIKPTPLPWKQWLEVGSAGAIGSYKVVNRDCNGDVISIDKVDTKSFGGELSSNWQRDWTHYQVGIRGTFGQAESSDLTDTDHNFSYSAIGLRGSADWKIIGLSLGVFHRKDRYPDIFGTNYPDRSQVLPSVALRIGRLDKYYFDMRLFDEPTLGFANEPIFSIGMLNLGFGDPSGNSRLRAGLGVSSAGEGSFHLGGQFPLGNSGVTGSLSTYLGGTNMVSLGFKYRFMERKD